MKGVHLTALRASPFKLPAVRSLTLSCRICNFVDFSLRSGGEAAALPPPHHPLFSRETPVISTAGRDLEVRNLICPFRHR